MTLAMRPSRTETERSVDLLFVLCAADLAHRLPASPGSTVVQKIFFWSKLALAQSGIRAPAHPYIRYNYGPYSAALSSDLQLLQAQGLLHSTRFAPTDRGAQIARHYRQLLEGPNQAVFAALDESVKKRARWTAGKAKSEAYRLRVSYGGQEMTLRELPMGISLDPDPGSASPFNIDARTAEDLLADLSLSADEYEATRRPGRTLSKAEFETLVAR